LAKSDPMVQCTIEETGEHIIAGQSPFKIAMLVWCVCGLLPKRFIRLLSPFPVSLGFWAVFACFVRLEWASYCWCVMSCTARATVGVSCNVLQGLLLVCHVMYCKGYRWCVMSCTARATVFPVLSRIPGCNVR